jgi:hypothetical protein
VWITGALFSRAFYSPSLTNRRDDSRLTFRRVSVCMSERVGY